MLERMLGTCFHKRDGRCDLDIMESQDGTFAFAKSRKTMSQELGTTWTQTFFTQPPCQSISIMMADRHLGRIQIATCNNDEGVRLKQILEKLERVATTFADHSAQSIRNFLLVQPSEYTLPPQQNRYRGVVGFKCR